MIRLPFHVIRLYPKKAPIFFNIIVKGGKGVKGGGAGARTGRAPGNFLDTL